MTRFGVARACSRACLIGVAALTMVMATTPAAHATTVTRTVRTTGGRNCYFYANAHRGGGTGALNLMYGFNAECDFGTIGNIDGMQGSVELYDSLGSRVRTHYETCSGGFACDPFAHGWSYSPALPGTTYRAVMGIVINLNPTHGEKFVTPSPSGCNVYDSGFSVWCHSMTVTA